MLTHPRVSVCCSGRLKDMLHDNKVRRERVIERPPSRIPLPPGALALALNKLGNKDSREKASRQHLRSTTLWPGSNGQNVTWQQMSGYAPKPRIEPPLFSPPGSMR